ncbi:MAG: response regulator [Bacteroidia bacterium]|nr:response regulator [Bacteroidia bacterium]
MSEILFIDDNEADYFLFEMLLKKRGIDQKIIWLDNGELAREYLFREGQFEGLGKLQANIIFLDLNIPRIDGFELLELLRQHPQAEELSIIIHSSSSFQKDIETAYELGASLYLEKKIDVDEYEVNIARALEFLKAQKQTGNPG